MIPALVLVKVNFNFFYTTKEKGNMKLQYKLQQICTVHVII